MFQPASEIGPDLPFLVRLRKGLAIVDLPSAPGGVRVSCNSGVSQGPGSRPLNAVVRKAGPLHPHSVGREEPGFHAPSRLTTARTLTHPLRFFVSRTVLSPACAPPFRTLENTHLGKFLSVSE